MTLMNATTLNDQVDYLSTNGESYAERTLNSIFNISPQNAVVEDDDDDIDETIPDPDEDDLLDDDEDDAFPDDDETDVLEDDDELDTIDDDDDADVVDDDLDNDDNTGSTTSGLSNPSSFADRPQGRTTGRMTDHEPGS